MKVEIKLRQIEKEEENKKLNENYEIIHLWNLP